MLLEVASMAVSWWIVAFLRSDSSPILIFMETLNYMVTVFGTSLHICQFLNECVRCKMANE